MAVATQLPVEELSFALGVYGGLHDATPRAVRSHLDLTPRSHFDEACLWVKSNGAVITLLADDPVAVQAGSYALSEARSWFSRLLGLGRSRKLSAPGDDELERLATDLAKRKPPMTEKKAAKIAELRDLVDDAFDAG